jgi:hypothetical protein
MANLPKVSVLYANGNLLQDIAVLDGIAALCGTGSTPALLGVPKTVNSLKEAETLGFTVDAEPTMHRHLTEFYGEVGGNQELHIMIVPNTMTMAQMVDDTNVSGLKRLLSDALGKCSLAGVFRTPPNGYNGGSDFIDSDVAAALTASKIFGQARLAELAPVRMLIEGRVQNMEIKAAATYAVTTPGTAGNTVTLKVDDGSGTLVTLGSYAVLNADTNNLVAAGLRTAIAALTGTHGYTVSGTNANVIVAPPDGKGSNANSYVLSAVVTGTVAGTITQFAGGAFQVANTLIPTSFSNGFAGVVLGGSLPDGSASVGLTLGRAVKYAAEIKLGKVANGPLSISTCYIGEQLIKDVTNLDTLHGDGFISFMQHPQKAGYYFGIDRMATTDDYRLLAYNRIVDKACKIATSVYVEQLESEIDIDAQGNIDSLALAGLEAKITQNINVVMGSQISGLIVYINPAQNLINSNTLSVQISVRPKGYSSFIDVTIGLTSN